MKPQLMKRLSVLFVLAIAALACQARETAEDSGLRATTAEECRIGLVMPTTGGMATYGAEGVLAARIALEEARAVATASSPILKEEDSASDPTQANEAASALLGNRRPVEAIVGEINSADTAAMVSLSRESNVPIIAPTASLISLTEMSGNLVRIWPSDSYEATRMLEYMKSEGITRVGVIFLRVPYGEELADYFQDQATSAGMVVATEGYPEATTDFAPLLRRLSEFENIYVVSYLEDAALILNEAYKMRARLPHEFRFFGTSVLDSSELVEKAGLAAEGLTFAVVQPGQDGDPELRARFESEYKKLRSSLGAAHPLGEAATSAGFAGFHVYDAASIAFAACEEIAKRGERISGEEILKYLHSMLPYTGITGRIEFDENGDLVHERRVVFKTIRAGEIQEL